MKSTDIEYSIILPCLNEEKTLGICIRKIHQFFSNTGLTYEIIVADNGSTGKSERIWQCFETWHRTLQWEIYHYG